MITVASLQLSLRRQGKPMKAFFGVISEKLPAAERPVATRRILKTGHRLNMKATMQKWQ